ncbi:hypothetical protein [Asanoa iriomotensis]|uniref:Uncharacterized protein n=1 Tax=Asanoa iriomotensis TaxID=234613 RepID=A0ABQ4CGN6_9ACTN|nr:hypothetical protein [Asanoa iriomotensis]GIF61928.1 hypothetical protein Air01nite_80230 [Asanoa iriomotensis]
MVTLPSAARPAFDPVATNARGIRDGIGRAPRTITLRRAARNARHPLGNMGCHIAVNQRGIGHRIGQGPRTVRLPRTTPPGGRRADIIAVAHAEAIRAGFGGVRRW